MKKILGVMIFMTYALYSMDDGQGRPSLPSLLRAAIELNGKKAELVIRIEAQAQFRSAPDFFGIFTDDCILPESFACCQDLNLRQKFLDSIEAHEMRKALALNCLGFIYKQKPIGLIAPQRFAHDNGIVEFYAVEKKDVRKAFTSE